MHEVKRTSNIPQTAIWIGKKERDVRPTVKAMPMEASSTRYWVHGDRWPEDCGCACHGISARQQSRSSFLCKISRSDEHVGNNTIHLLLLDSTWAVSIIISLSELFASHLYTPRVYSNNSSTSDIRCSDSTYPYFFVVGAIIGGIGDEVLEPIQAQSLHQNVVLSA